MKKIITLILLAFVATLFNPASAELRRGSNKEMLIRAKVKILQVKHINASIGKDMQKQKIVTRFTVKILSYKDLNREAQAFPREYNEMREYLKSNQEEIDLIVDWAGEKLYLNKLAEIKNYDSLEMQIGIGRCQIGPKVGRRNPPRFDAYLVGIPKQKK